MKRSDLKYRYSWDERRPYLENQVLFIPKYYELHKEWDIPSCRTCFENENPIFVEYCSGNGAWILERAEAEPSKNWIAVEYDFERVRKIWIKRERRELKNVLIVSGEALTFTKEYLESELIQGCFVNFPDPWPKKKHAKNRLIQQEFIQELSRVMKPEAIAHFVTDDIPYSEQMIQEMGMHKWKQIEYLNEFPGYGSSYFESLWRSKGLMIHHLRFVKGIHG